MAASEARRAFLAALDKPRTYVRHDDYPADRCACGHLVYPTDTPGGSCRWACGCTRHESRNRPAGSDAA